MGDERRDDAAERRLADASSSARIGAAAALIVLLVLDIAVPGCVVSPEVLLPLLDASEEAAASARTGPHRPGESALAHGPLNRTSVLARPTGFEPADTTIFVRVPIARRSW